MMIQRRLWDRTPSVQALSRVVICLSCCLAVGFFCISADSNRAGAQERIARRNSLTTEPQEANDNDRLDEQVAELQRVHLELKPILSRPGAHPEEIGRLKALATPEVVNRLAQGFLEADASGLYHRDRKDLVYRLGLDGLAAADEIIEATTLGHLVGKLPTSHVNFYDPLFSAQTDAWPQLLPLTTSRSPEARQWAIRMGRFAMPAHPEAVERWHAMALDASLSDDDRAAAVYTLRSAEELSSEQVESLIPYLGLDQSPLLNASQNLFFEQAESAVPVFIKRLGESESKVQVGMLDCMSQMKQAAESAAEVIRLQLNASTREVRLAAASAYWNCTGDLLPVIERLKIELQDEPHRRVWDLCVLMGPAAAETQELIAQQIKRLRAAENYDQRALEALGALGPEASAQLPLLEECLSDEPVVWFSAAAVAWSAIAQRPGIAAEVLEKRLAAHQFADPSLPGNLNQMRVLLLTARKMGPHAAPAAPTLASVYLNWMRTPVRDMPLRALAAIGPEALPALHQIAFDARLSGDHLRAINRCIEEIEQTSK